MSSAQDSIDLEALEREAIRLCRRYIDEVVLPFELCPWAAPALRQQRVEILAFPQLVNSSGHPLDAAARWGAQALARLADEQRTELVLLVYPRCQLTRSDFDGLVRTLRQHPESSEYVMAAFHPAATLDLASPDRLIPYLRRSPDPMVQAVRKATLDRINPGKGSGTAFLSMDRFLAGDWGDPSGPSPSERVAQDNWTTVRERGPEALQQVLEEIREDRRRTYDALGYSLRE
jgi:hypothetical protein